MPPTAGRTWRRSSRTIVGVAEEAGLVIAGRGRASATTVSAIASCSRSRAARQDHRLRRARHRAGRAQVPQLPGDAAVREGPRALRPVPGAQPQSAMRKKCSWSRATWTSSRSPSMGSTMRWPHSARRPRPGRCRNCCGRATTWCTASTVTSAGRQGRLAGAREQPGAAAGRQAG